MFKHEAKGGQIEELRKETRKAGDLRAGSSLTSMIQVIHT
jgi:hypothetical protein